MKKQRGFTLVELLAVIVILGIIISLSTVAIAGIKEKQDKKNYENVISSILTGAKAYNVDNKISIGSSISVETLLEKGYVDFDQKKYEKLINEIVTKNICDDNDLKEEYIFSEEFTRDDESKYNYTDCGCEAQTDEPSYELCEKNKDS